MQHQARRSSEGPRAAGRAWVQHPGPFALVAEQTVSMAIDDRAGVGVVTAQALVPFAGREETIAVYHGQEPARELQRRLEGKLLQAVTFIFGPFCWAVVVSTYRHDCSCRSERSEHAGAANVTGMHSAVACAHDLRDAWIEHAVRISEDGYAHAQRWATRAGVIRGSGVGTQAAAATRVGPVRSRRARSRICRLITERRSWSAGDELHHGAAPGVQPPLVHVALDFSSLLEVEPVAFLAQFLRKWKLFFRLNGADRKR